jgi:hypothetical protein
MKRLMFSLALATVVLAASAQEPIKANFKKGDTQTFVITEENNISDAVTTTNTKEICYKVTQADDTKATIECVMTAFDTKSTGDDKGAAAMDEVNQMLAKLKDVPVIIETNAAGKVMKMVNREQIEEKMNVIIKEFVDNIFKMAPEMAQAMKKEDMEKAMHAKLTEKEILDEFTENIFDLYDKPIANNYEEVKDVDGLRLKLTYTVANIFGTQNITAKGVVNMTKEETKELFFAQIDQAGLPDDQVQMIKSNFDQLALTGMAKIEANTNTVYQLDADGWLKGMKDNSEINLFGQAIKQKTTISRK